MSSVNPGQIILQRQKRRFLEDVAKKPQPDLPVVREENTKATKGANVAKPKAAAPKPNAALHRGELKKTSTRFYADTIFDVSDRVTALRRQGHRVAAWQIFQAAIDLVLTDEKAFKNLVLKKCCDDMFLKF